METVVEKICDHAKTTPDRLAVIFEDEALTYKELWESALRLSDFFKRSGVRKGDCVVCQSVYSSWYAVVCYAAHLCRAAFVPVDKNISAELVAQTAEDLSAKCVIARQKAPSDRVWLTFQELPECTASGSLDTEVTMPGADDTACVMFTTGTTGKPKGVVLSHKSIVTNGKLHYDRGLLFEEETYLTIVPVNHVGPMWRMFAHAYYGGTSIFLDGILKIKKMYEYIEKYNVAVLGMTPSVLGIFIQLGSDKLAQYADQIRVIGTGSASISEPQIQYITQTMPKTKIFFEYGSSELGTICCRQLHYNDTTPVNCVGSPHPWVSIRVVDENLEDVPTGEQGIIIAKSDMNFSGYWNNPELTAQCLRDGYVVSSDIGSFDEEGNLFLAGRRDDMMNIGGLKVFPGEIENAAESIPGVAECICCKVKDTVAGQAARLIVKKTDNSDLTLAQLRQGLMRRLDPYKVPKYIEFADHIARTANGKPDRKAYEQKEPALV